MEDKLYFYIIMKDVLQKELIGKKEILKVKTSIRIFI
jgi:hypothetical protein